MFIWIVLSIFPMSLLAESCTDFDAKFKSIREVAAEDNLRALDSLDSLLKQEEQSLSKFEQAELLHFSLYLLARDNRYDEQRIRAYQATILYSDIGMTKKVLRVKIVLYKSYYFGGDPSKSSVFLEEAYKIAKANNHFELLVEAQSLLAEDYTNSGNYTKALTLTRTIHSI